MAERHPYGLQLNIGVKGLVGLRRHDLGDR
jgi:hypothetical protein